MRSLSFLCLVTCALSGNHHHHTQAPTTTPDPTTDAGRIFNLEGTVDLMEKKLEALTRQLLLQQLYVAEKSRSDGDSGIKQLRHNHDGTRAFMSDTHSMSSINSIHDHTNYKLTVGMGEVIAVLNGVEFRTRHNDYKLKMPSRTSHDYHAIEEIPFPPVPPSVLAKPTLKEQIEEMRNYFKAWKYQNPQYRDYRKYFKPVLCYMEGAWTKSTETLDEPFESDRHFVDAASWFDLQEKIRYTSYTGGKSNLENYSYLPSIIMNVINGTAEFAQWNYRILCHPIKREVPLKVLEPVDDLASRLTKKMTLQKFTTTRAARFNLAASEDRCTYNPDTGYGTIFDKSYRYGLIDQIMGEIPGKDNYRGNLTDLAIGDSVPLLEAYGGTPTHPKVLNTAFYHRMYKSNKKGAMGTTVNHRGYADMNMWVAQTTQPKVASVSMEWCHRRLLHKPCEIYDSKYSYAIPLEIIYLTPLHTWNPYNLESTDAKTLSTNRTGGFNATTAYRGINEKYYYFMTPTEFFSGTEVNKDKADTVKNAVGVLDRHGNVRSVKASGTRVFLPDIEGVGKLRQRWPITPIYREGSSIAKELEAVKEMVNHMSAYSPYFQEPPASQSFSSQALKPDGFFQTGVSTKDPPGRHYHEFFLHNADMELAMQGQTVKATTSEESSHSHDLEIRYDAGKKQWLIVKCDGMAHCWDGHPALLTLQS